jgi:antirestriction protein ArdC
MATSIVSQYVRPSVPSPVQSSVSTARPHASVYEIVTEQVIKQLESGVAPWRKPWRTEMPCNLISGNAYRGMNVFLLGSQGCGFRKFWHVNSGNSGTVCTGWQDLLQVEMTRSPRGSVEMDEASSF